MESNTHEIVVVQSPAPVYVEADAVRLTQVFLNLLNNAIKFTPANGRITLSIVCESKEVRVHIRDTGQGIDRRDLAHVFEMFYQGERASGGVKAGLGLGLSLVQNLVEMHGGSVRAESPGRDRGSEFVVRLPIIPGPAQFGAVPESAPCPRQSAAPRRILVVDDNRDIVESLAHVLRLAGNEVDTALDGDAALEAVTNLCPDIVLLDIGMPLVDGYAVARAIRRGPGGNEILLIATTGWGQSEDRRRVIEAGFDAHLVKPASIDALLDLCATIKRGGLTLPTT